MPGIAPREVEAALRTIFDSVRKSIESARKGKFVNLAVFDHASS